MKKHIMIGALPPPLGGTTVLFQQLVDELMIFNRFDVFVINTSNKSSGIYFKLVTLIKTIYLVMKNIRSSSSVSFHGSINGALLFFPILRLLCILFNRPVIFRSFGGDFDVKHKNMPQFKQWIFNKFVLSADVLLFETKVSVEYFSSFTQSEIEWYANSRPFDNSSLPEKNKSNDIKVVFIGHVKPSKGVVDLVKAANSNDNNIEVHVYGPLQDGLTEMDLNGVNTRYCGVLKPENITSTLSNYNWLALPTYYDGEGYPGVILEAFSMGLPVLTTKWRCIPEIVDETCGLLVEPCSSAAILDALKLISSDDIDYSLLHNGAINQADNFSSKKWTKIYANIVIKLSDNA